MTKEKPKYLFASNFKL